MDDNRSTGIIASQSAHESLFEEKAARLGAGKFWNIIHLLNELDYLHIQERQVGKPLDEAFITKALWWYYLQRGVSGGILCGMLLFVIRAIHVGLSFVISEDLNNAWMYMVTAFYVYYLASFLRPMVKYHCGATTKAVNLVLQGGVSAVVLVGFMKSYVVFMLIFYQNEILAWIARQHYDSAVTVFWIYNNIFGPGYVEICFMVSVLIGGGAALAKFSLLKKDLQADKERGRPYNRVSIDR